MVDQKLLETIGQFAISVQNALHRNGLMSDTQLDDLVENMTTEFSNSVEVLGIPGNTAEGENPFEYITAALGEITAHIDSLQNADANIRGIIATLAPLNNAPLTGIPTAPTPAPGTNTTQVVNAAFVHAAISSLIDGAPEALDTLREFAAALGDDPNFVGTITTALADKLGKTETAVAATKLATPRMISLLGGATGSIPFDGSANVTIPVVVTDNSHSHLISNVSGLQTALDGKLANNGNAVSATVLQTPRTISLSGGATGSIPFNGSSNVTIPVAIVDDSHNHVIANVDGLQTALDSKIPVGGNAATATALQTARTINGVSFNGTANITVADATKLPLTGGTLTGALGLPNSTTLTGTANGLQVTNGVNGTFDIGNRNTGYTHYGSSTGNHYFYGNVTVQTSFSVGGVLTAGDVTLSGKITAVATNRASGLYGTYDSAKIDHIWAMGAAYVIPADGSTFGNLYGMAYKHTTNVTGGAMAGGHQIVFCSNGTPGAAIGLAGNIWTSGQFIGSGASLTALNAAQLTTGILPNARLSGSYDGIVNLTGSGNVDFAKFLGLAADTAAAPSFTWTGDTATGLYRPAASQVAISIAGVQRALISAAGISGVGTGLTALNASNITTGTVPDAVLPTTITSSITGNAATATALQTARTINGVSFNGTANITISASDPASVTKTGDTMTGNLTLNDNVQVRLGSSADTVLYHNGSHTYFDHNVTGDLYIRNQRTGGAIYLQADSTGGTLQNVVQAGVGADNACVLFASGGARLTTTAAGVSITGTMTASSNVTGYSDIRLKANLQVIPNALDKVDQLRGVTFDRIDTGERQTGLIAQEVQKVLPEAVIALDDEQNTLTLAYGNMVGLLVESIKELRLEVKDLRQQINELKKG